MSKSIPELLDELSFLSRETIGASFVIQHSKDSGLWKVVFSNAMVTIKNDPIREYVEFDQALITAIDWVRNRRKLVDVPSEKYTLFGK